MTYVPKCSTVVLISVFVLILFSVVWAEPPADTLSVLHISDTHICNLDNYHPVFAEAREHYGHGTEPLVAFLENAPKIANTDFIVLTGDIIDYYEAETHTEKMLATQIEQFYPLYNKSPVPLFMTLGNHDITSYWVDEADTSEEYEKHQIHADEARAVWIRNIPCFFNGTYYARHLELGKTTYHLLFLDNSYSLHDGARRIDKTQLDWLDYHVEKAGKDPVIIFMHIYLPVGDKNGDGVFFNSREKSWPDEESCSTGLLHILNRSDNIKAIFVGHGHKNVIEKIDFPAGHDIFQCETGGFGKHADNWRLLRFTEKNILISTPGDGQVEMIISLFE